MPTVAITDTEVNPPYVAGGGGGLKTLGPETEGNPTYFGEGGGGWNVFAETELSPLLPAPEVTTDPALWIGPLSATLDGLLDSGGGIQPCDCGFEWGETVAYGETTPTEKKETSEGFSQAITGLLPNTTYHFRAFATGFGTGYSADRTFITAPAAILATVTTDPAIALSTTAISNGTLNQDGGEFCQCGFEYGETEEYGMTTPSQRKTTGKTFSQVIDRLFSTTTYHFRAFATNSLGTSYGADRTFTTLATISAAVTTDEATNVRETSATPNGTLDDDGGEACDVRFQYGFTTDYGTNTAWQPGKTTGDAFSQSIVVVGGKLYHFRAQARNNTGTVNGADRTLTTIAPLVVSRAHTLSREEL